jgi:hypothetical protein
MNGNFCHLHASRHRSENADVDVSSPKNENFLVSTYGLFRWRGVVRQS